MRAQEKAPWLLIVAVVVMSYAIVTAAGWVFPVKASPTPELNDRWLQWAKEIQRHERAEETDTRPGKGVPVVPPTSPQNSLAP